ncbi:MAG: histidine kinase, partial [Methylophilaceae bacterium]|nr:histidine kinase [Methylophilaceae bacterium]
VRLNLMITLLLFSVIAVGTILSIQSAREDVRAEVISTASLASRLLDAEILHYTSDYAWLNGADRNRASIFNLESLADIRHLKIEFYDRSGRLRDSNREQQADRENAPPSWFIKLMDVTASDALEVRRVIYASGRVIGELVISPDASFEIEEIWNDTQGSLWLAVIFFVTVNAMVYWALRKALRPVGSVVNALNALEKGNLDARLPQFELPELSSLSVKFNAMAQTLQQSIKSNHRLTQKIIRVQEDERKNLARELHDEIGQCMTAINIDAMAITNSKNLADAKRSANAISEVSMQILNMVHSMLQRLRPSVLDELGLSMAISEYVYSWCERNSGISYRINIAKDLGAIDEEVALAAYRIIQESLTNITRHASARRMKLTVSLEQEHLLIELEDDGKGFDPNGSVSGYGLAGIRERAQGLKGTFSLMTTPGNGTKISVQLPIYIEEAL